MTGKLYISESEFDRLNYAEQRSYKYCTICEQFYVYDYLKNGCEHYEHDPRD